MEKQDIIRTGDFTESMAPMVTNTRNILVVGCGDGGCNIASTIAQAIPDNCFAIAYNMSNRAMDYQTANTRIWPFGVDGSGKVRVDATETFKKTTGRKFMERVMEVVAKMERCDYVLVVGTADGGTGSGTVPIMAKLMAANLDIPVVILGVYPSINEDAMSQYNAIQWQKEVTMTGLPYIILDNNSEGTLTDVHHRVNNYAADIAKLLVGKTYGNTDISIIDNRNLYMLIQQMGGRIVIAGRPGRINSQDDLSTYIMNTLLPFDFQPEPAGVKGIGLFVKGPKELIDRADTDLLKLQETYGQAVLKFAHLEISEETRVSVLLSGCAEPADRLRAMQGKYDDVTNASRDGSILAKDIAGAMANPLGELKTMTRPETMDFSALEG